MQMQAAPMCVGDRNPAFSEFREFRGHLTYLARLEAAARVLWRSEVGSSGDTLLILLVSKRPHAFCGGVRWPREFRRG